jgi:hypothetical protein
MKNENQLQQGDVTITRIDSLPEGNQKHVSRGRCVLAEGEATGHGHVIDCEDAELIQIGERMLLRLGVSAPLIHEEHKPITLEPGLYEIGRVAEYDYLSEMTRNVQD